MKKRIKKNKSSKKRLIIIISISIFLLIAGFIITNKLVSTGKSVDSSQTQIQPLSPHEKQKVLALLESSEMIKDIPEKNPIAIQFFKFEKGKRIWQDGFLLADGKFLSEGEPALVLILHSKYLSELNENNLCEVIRKANTNGDLGFESEHSEASLLWKYKSLLKYRDCFGF